MSVIILLKKKYGMGNLINMIIYGLFSICSEFKIFLVIRKVRGWQQA